MTTAVGDVVQLYPDCDLAIKYGGPLLVIVSEVKQWGIQGYFFCISPGGGTASPAYVRVENGYFTRIGKAEWTLE